MGRVFGMVEMDHLGGLGPPTTCARAKSDFDRAHFDGKCPRRRPVSTSTTLARRLVSGWKLLVHYVRSTGPTLNEWILS